MKSINRSVILTAAAAAIALICFICSAEHASALSGPVMNENGVTTWDTVYFGTYPQGSDGNGGFIDEPIRWRVLKVEGDDALIVSDKNIDAMPYCAADEDPKYDCFWHESTLRSWLNGFDASTNKKGIDYSDVNFIDRAFTEEEKAAVKTTEVKTIRESDWGYHHYEMTTTEKIFLLDCYDIMNRNYGFPDDEEAHPSRTAVNTAYTAAGGSSGYGLMKPEGNKNSWLLRTPGEYSMYADCIIASGAYDDIAIDSNSVQAVHGIRPVLHLDLSKTSVWSDAGKYSARFEQKITVPARYEKKCGSDSFQIAASTDGDSILEFSSDNEAVASVDASGTVTVGKVGTAVITVTAPMTDTYQEPSKTLTVVVKKGTRKIIAEDMTILMTDTSAVFPVVTDAGKSLVFESLDPSVAMISQEGIITPVSPGTASILVTAPGDDDFNEFSDTFTLTVEEVVPSISAKKTKFTLKTKKLRKKAQTVKFTASSESGGKLTYSRKSGSKKIKVANSGKLTVKKGTKKGTYKVTVLVKCAASSPYSASSKTVKVTVRVK